jgi:hypothetical protein
MKKYHNLRLTSVCLLCVTGAASFFFWKKGTPYQPPYWSPNGQYYVQKYSNLTLSRFVSTMPGQGSDAIDGYIRLYDKNGELIHERFADFIRDVKPIWAENKVYLMGVEEMDNDPWILPTTSE